MAAVIKKSAAKNKEQDGRHSVGVFFCRQAFVEGKHLAQVRGEGDGKGGGGRPTRCQVARWVAEGYHHLKEEKVRHSSTPSHTQKSKLRQGEKLISGFLFQSLIRKGFQDTRILTAEEEEEELPAKNNP